MTTDTQVRKPPMESSDEATAETLELARKQGEAYTRALEYMAQQEAHGAEKPAGDYLVAYAWEKAEGMYHLRGGKLEWQEPQKENLHLEIAVHDGADKRFIPGLKVHATLIDENGKEIGTHEQPFLWHPWLYHYGRNWEIPGEGTYTLKVNIDPPEFGRHDKKNGRRYAEPVEVTFENIRLKTGQK